MSDRITVRFRNPHHASDLGRVRPGETRELDARRARGLKSYGIVEYAVAPPVETPEHPATPPLPDDFPVRDLLADAGLETLERVRAASDDDLLALDGVGPKRLREIREAAG